MLPRRHSHPLDQKHAALDVDPIVFELNTQASIMLVLALERCRCSDQRGVRRVRLHFSRALVPVQPDAGIDQWRRCRAGEFVRVDASLSIARSACNGTARPHG